MEKIRIAQIGTSAYSHGYSIFRTLLAHPELFEVVGYALPENEREKFPAQMPEFSRCREMTVEEILADPTIEAVAVETEEIYLTKYALMVAKAGKHLHMEKPGGEAYTISSAQNLTWGEVAQIYTELLGVKFEWVASNYPKDLWIWHYDRAYDRIIDNSKILKATGLNCLDFKTIKEGIEIELKKLGAI